MRHRRSGDIGTRAVGSTNGQHQGGPGNRGNHGRKGCLAALGNGGGQAISAYCDASWLLVQ
jgi:hypothetical protein